MNYFKILAYDEFVLYSRVTSIDSLHVDSSISSPDPNRPVQTIKNTNHIRNVVALAIDYANKRFFFSDIFFKAIKQASLDGSNITTIVHGN